MRPTIRITGLLLFIFFMACLEVAADPGTPLSTILDGIEKRYDGQGFSAKFFQESMLKAMQISDTAEGHLTAKKPGKMRWEYTIPEPQTIITNGRKMWIFKPADNQVMVGKAPDFFADGKGAGFLSDIRQIRKGFTITLQQSDNKAYHRLRLVPKKPSQDLAEVIISVEKERFTVDQILTYNAYGDETHIVLADFRFNLNPEDALFNFTIPEGVDVVQMDQP